jgi:hypothetical protein
MALPAHIITHASPHREAMDWLSRVIAQGSTASLSTVMAVSRFCRAIDSAGVRDRFYRLNPFSGETLSGALVPLYRATSFGGSIVGNATDTNVNFVSADFAETGSTGGLKGNASNKYLNTGVNFAAAPVATICFGVWGREIETTAASNTDRQLIGSLNGASSFQGAVFGAAWNYGGLRRNADFIAPSVSAGPYISTGIQSSGVIQCGHVGANSYSQFANGSVLSTSTTASALGTATGNQSGPILVFCRNDSGSSVSPYAYSAARLSGYYIGRTMDAAQHAVVASALASLLAALGRA